MPATLIVPFICIYLVLGFAQMGSAADAATPQEVISRMVVNASQKVPGPVESDVTAQSVKCCETLKAALHDNRSVREMLVATYGGLTLEGPLTPLYLEGKAAIFYGKAKLSDDALTEQKETDQMDPYQDKSASHGKSAEAPTEGGIGFGESGGSSEFVGPKIKNAHVIVTFCLLQEKELWKVHCIYLSNDVLDKSNQAIVIRELTALAEKKP